jgi:uracil-DNA glycosylase
MDPSWATALAPVEPDIRKMGDFLRSQIESGHRVLPASKNIFRAFDQPLDSVKVLIVGQDPYPTPGNPIGLAFSVAPDAGIPASLNNIFKELGTDLGLPYPLDGDLTPWTKQGVMLLNRCLSVEAGRPASHRNKGWEPITDQAVRVLDARIGKDGKPLPLVAILWGRQAQSLAPLLPHAAIIASPHPSPLSASRGFFGSRPFSRTNEALEKMGTSPVDWRLPSKEDLPPVSDDPQF